MFRKHSITSIFTNTKIHFTKSNFHSTKTLDRNFLLTPQALCQMLKPVIRKELFPEEANKAVQYVLSKSKFLDQNFYKQKSLLEKEICKLPAIYQTPFLCSEITKEYPNFVEFIVDSSVYGQMMPFFSQPERKNLFDRLKNLIHSNEKNWELHDYDNLRNSNDITIFSSLVARVIDRTPMNIFLLGSDNSYCHNEILTKLKTKIDHKILAYLLAGKKITGRNFEIYFGETNMNHVNVKFNYASMHYYYHALPNPNDIRFYREGALIMVLENEYPERQIDMHYYIHNRNNRLYVTEQTCNHGTNCVHYKSMIELVPKNYHGVLQMINDDALIQVIDDISETDPNFNLEIMVPPMETMNSTMHLTMYSKEDADLKTD